MGFEAEPGTLVGLAAGVPLATGLVDRSEQVVGGCGFGERGRGLQQVLGFVRFAEDGEVLGPSEPLVVRWLIGERNGDLRFHLTDASLEGSERLMQRPPVPFLARREDEEALE